MMQIIRFAREAKRYAYKPLSREPGRIRLVTLLPDTGSPWPKCTLAHVSLNNDPAPEYEALSYVWKSVPGHAFIYLDDTLIKVGWNLFLSLMSIEARSKEPRTLWIDALCINQTDNEERSNQVRQMSRIYSSASRVIVWLSDGHIDDDADHIIEIIGSPQFENAVGNVKDPSISWQMLQTMEKSFPGVFADIKAWQQFALLFEDPWFFRVWTLQELVLGQKVIFYTERSFYTWEKLDIVILFLKQVQYLCHEDGYKTKVEALLPQIMNVIKFIRLPDRLSAVRQDFSLNQSVELMSLIWSVKSRNATEERDRIFALRGLLNEKEMEAISVDYTLPFVKLRCQVTRNLIMATGGCDILMLAGMKSSKSKRLPSWCPSFEAAANVVPQSFLYTLFGRAFSMGSWQAGGPAALSNVNFHKLAALDEQKVTLGGILIDKINHRFSKFFDCPPKKYHVKIFDQLVSAIVNSGFEFEASLTEAYKDRHSAAAAYFERQYNRALVLGFDHEPKSTSTNAPLVHRDDCLWSGRSFVAGTIFFGKGPPEAQEGDFLCVLLGARCPFIVRNVKRSDEWILVGACYVDGIMHGEIMQDVANGRRKVQDFTFR